MADNEREFKIKITTSASGDGAQKTAAELDNLSPKTRKYIESLKEGGSAAENMEVSHRNLRYGLRMLGPEFAELGHLGMVAFANPLTAGFIAVAVAAGKVIHDYEKMREAIESAVDTSGIEKVTAALGRDGMLKALVEGGAAADEFWAKINRLAGAQESLKEKTDDAVESIKKESEANDKTLSALEKAALAELKLAKARGDITEGEYEQRKAGVENRFEGQKANAKAIEQDRILEERKRELAGVNGIIGAGPDVLLPKQLAAESAAGTVAADKAKLEEWKKKLEEINKWFKEQGGASDAATYAEQGKARRLALGKIADLEGGGIAQGETRAKTAAEELAEARRKVEDAQKRKAELDREIARLEADRTRDAGTRASEGGANRRARGAEAEAAIYDSPAGKLMKDVGEAENTLRQGGRITMGQASQIRTAAEALKHAGVSQGETILAAFGALHNNQQAFERRLLQLASQIQAQGKQNRNAQSP